MDNNLKPLQRNAVQVALDTLISNLYELRDHFDIDHSLDTHSVWTLQLIYDYLSDEWEGMVDCIKDEIEYSGKESVDYEGLVEKEIAQRTALEIIKKVIKEKENQNDNETNS